MLIFIESKKLIPKSLYFNIDNIKWILSFGFIPYLSGVFSYANIQVERWSITYWLGTEQMGKFYLPIAFAAVYALVPTSLNNLFFPKAMQYFNEKQYAAFFKYIQSYFLILLIYACMAALLTLSLSEYVIAYFFPKHLENVKYVFMVLPGLSAITLIAPIGLVFNASLVLKPMLWAYFTSTIVLIIGVGGILFFKFYSLSYFAILNSTVNIYISFFFVLAFILLKRKINQINSM
jgi:O-antigen/teichoic acid export membrane protein